MLLQLVGQVVEPDLYLGVPLRNASPDIPAGLDVGGLGEPLHADDTLLTDEAEVLPGLGADGLTHPLYSLSMSLKHGRIFSPLVFSSGIVSGNCTLASFSLIQFSLLCQANFLRLRCLFPSQPLHPLSVVFLFFKRHLKLPI